MNRPSEAIHVCAIIRAKPGMEQQLKAALIEVVAKTQQEPGCLQFNIHEIKSDPQQFILWECFASREALQEHIATDYTQHYFSIARSMMSQPTEVIELDLLQ